MTRIGRKTEWLNKRQASGFMAAHRFAEAMGRPLNLAVTFNLSHTSCHPDHASEAFEHFRDSHFTRWFRYQSDAAVKAGKAPFGPPTYTWVIEAKNGYPHVHWNVYIPPLLEKAFRARLEKWLVRSAGEIEKPFGAIHIQPVTLTRGLAKYCMKGIDPHHAKALYINQEDQGTVRGKRCGVSRNLGPSARRAFRKMKLAA